MFHILASLLCLCYAATSCCTTLTDAFSKSISAVMFTIAQSIFAVILLLINPLPLILSLLIGIGIYYWFLKPISLECAFVYVLISFISSVISLFLIMMLPKITSTFIIKRSYALGALFVTMLVLSSIIIDMLIMHHLFKYPYKRIALPIIADVIIRFAVIGFIAWLTPPMLGP